MENLIKHLSRLDWVLGCATIAYGLWASNMLIAGAGVLGLAMAWYGPAKRIQKYMESRLLAKTGKSASTTDALAAESFYAQMLDPVDAGVSGTLVSASLSPSAPLHFSGVMPAGVLTLGASRHNHLKRSFLNLHVDSSVQTSWH
jgi:hypothetical protein